MKKMMLLVFVVAAVCLVIPKFIGDTAHKAYLQSFDNYPKAATVQIEQVSYVQSWFSSDAVTVLKIPVNTPEIKTVDWVLTSHIQHGPLLLTDDGIQFGFAYMNTASSFSGLPDQYQSMVDRYLGKGVLTITTLIDLAQVSHDSLMLSPITFESEKASGTMGGLTMKGTSLLDYSMMKGDVILPASQVQASDIVLDIADAAGTYDYHKYNDTMMLGKMSMMTPVISVVAKQGKVSLENLSIVADITEEGEKLNMSESLRIKKIIAPVPVTAFEYEFELNQLDPKVFDLWAEVSESFQPTVGKQFAPMDKEKLRELATVFFQKGLEFNQVMKLDGMGGTLSIDADVRYIGLTDGTHLMDVKDRAQLLQAVDIHVLLEMDENIVMASPFAGMVAPYIEQGFVIKKDNKLVADIKLVGGELSSNGQALPQEIMQSFFGQPPAKINPNGHK